MNDKQIIKKIDEILVEKYHFEKCRRTKYNLSYSKHYINGLSVFCRYNYSTKKGDYYYHYYISGISISFLASFKSKEQRKKQTRAVNQCYKIQAEVNEAVEKLFGGA